MSLPVSAQSPAKKRKTPATPKPAAAKKKTPALSPSPEEAELSEEEEEEQPKKKRRTTKKKSEEEEETVELHSEFVLDFISQTFVILSHSFDIFLSEN